MNVSTLLYYISTLSGYGNQCRAPKINYKDCRFGQFTRWWYAYIAAKMVQKIKTSGKDVGAYWMIRPWFWQMLAETFALGPNFSIQTCNYGNEIIIATHLTFILWLAYRFKSYVLLLSGTDDFQEPDRLPRLGTASEWDRLAKSRLSGRFPLQSDLKHFGTDSVQHKKDQTRQKLIGKLDTVSAEILSWASRTKVFLFHYLDVHLLQPPLFLSNKNELSL